MSGERMGAEHGSKPGKRDATFDKDNQYTFRDSR